MMDVTDQPPTINALSPPKIPIAQICPSLENTSEKYIEAVVTLVWPYSSSTKSLGLLLSEPDFRLRHLHGQVKAVFHGRVAEKIAESHIGTSDKVHLRLKGASFLANDTSALTPGKNVAWDIHYDDEHGVSLEVHRSSKGSLPVTIEHAAHALHASKASLPSVSPRTVFNDPVVAIAPDQRAWASPAFLRTTSNNYSGILGSSYDPFVEDDGYIAGKGRKRPRYSLQRDDWHILDEPLSPQENASSPSYIDEVLDDVVDNELGTECLADSQSDNDILAPGATDLETPSRLRPVSREKQPSFVKPSLEHAGIMSSRRLSQSRSSQKASIGTNLYDRLKAASHLPTDTPQLRPIPSPGLPIPSPIVSAHNNTHEYFPQVHLASQEQGIQPLLPNIIDDDGLTVSNSASGTPSVSVTQKASSDAEDISHIPQEEKPVFIPGPPSFGHLQSTCVLGNQKAGMIDSLTADLTAPFELPRVPEHTQTVSSQREAEFAGKVESSAEPGEFGPHIQLMENPEALIYEVNREILFSGEGVGSGFESTQMIGPQEDTQQSYVVGTFPVAIQSETINEGLEEHSHRGLELENEDQNIPLSSVGNARQPSQSYSEDGSGVIHEEDSYDEELGAEYDWQQQDEDYSSGEEDVESEIEGDQNSGSAELPHTISNQPEVIVLDSDSEDEPVSNLSAITPPVHQGHRRNRRASVEFEIEDSVSDQSGGKYSVSFEADDDREVTADVALDQGNRSYDGELEDEPPEDASTRHYHSEDFSVPEILNEKGQDSDVSFDRDARDTLPDDHDVSKGATFIALDGASDHAWPHISTQRYSDDRSSPDKGDVESEGSPDQARRSVETGDSHTAGVSPAPIESIPVENTEQPLFTFHSTQEPYSGRRPSSHQEMSLSPPRNASAGLDVSSRTTPDAATSNFNIALQSDLASPVNLSNRLDATMPAAVRADTDRKVKEIAGIEALESPKVVISHPPEPDRRAQGLWSKLSYFAPLATLIDHYNALVDTISIVHGSSSIARAASGSQDYFVTIQLTDPSMAGTTLQAQIFRRHKSAMPLLAEGNAILLRDFKVRTYDHTVMLVSVESSSWAVFDGSGPEAQMNGPPVEYSSEERAFASGLRRWYSEVGASMVADRQLQISIEGDSIGDSIDAREPTPGSVVASESGSLDSTSRGDIVHSSRGSRRSRKSYRRVTIHELRDGRRYTEVGSPSSKESIHELRDGTLYANL